MPQNELMRRRDQLASGRSGSSRSKRQTSQVPSKALPNAKPITTKLAQVAKGLFCTIQASAADNTFSVTIIQNRGLRGWNRRENFMGTDANRCGPCGRVARVF